MKKTLASLASLLIAASASAHTSGVPHTHNESPLNWATILTVIAALAVSAFAFKSLRKMSNR
ncbi:hypothetical protein [Pelagicoccus mobilis]|uniref:Uncharacterized protein n=1 Tax=Pelagicoccus mobilis TaxID=415221 RepID=A0A934S0L4_9BACT|nr:hypothetical protein [Pelagicoccus mobilis]MBK1878804.1 hypothetical protein [Pelagicoccus mobilis]